MFVRETVFPIDHSLPNSRLQAMKGLLRVTYIPNELTQKILRNSEDFLEVVVSENESIVAVMLFDVEDGNRNLICRTDFRTNMGELTISLNNYIEDLTRFGTWKMSH